ncbi:MAG: hypothetical protein LBT12_02320 [Oscillospiraceae bacterium]|jgi:hypothetical protein|nr:hypothetical protein [Oscillospiraceae bacterium]
MAETMRSWILGLAGAAVIASVAAAVSPEGRVKRVVSLACGFMMILALLGPAARFDYTGFRQSLAELSEAEQYAPLDEVNEKLTGLIIEEKYAAYILDKGASLGMDDLAVTVTASWSENGYFYPERATLWTTADKTLRDKLAYAIESGLGLPPEELIWRDNDEQ